jgi:hypothetical protein
MATEQPKQTAADYVTIVLSPVLVMGLVGSLVLFLLEVFYKADGPWKERLGWILSFYVFGSVLTARISMMGDIAGRSRLYGIVLAFLTYLGMSMYVEMPEAIKPVSFLINLFLILLVWWCAHRLVWDCTNVDEDADMNAAGLLRVSGVEQEPAGVEVVEADVESDRKLSGFDLWWRRYQRYRERQGKKRSLGVWVVYFSLAALPIFGLGQALIPADAGDRRQWTFWLMTVYVGSGLGLLLTTCFLGLRRYLRQRNLQMPASMARAWLGIGAVLVLALLVVGGLMPRPSAEYSLLDIVDPAGSKARKANRMSAKGDSPGEGEGKPGNKGEKGDKGEQGEKDKGDKDKGEKGSKDKGDQKGDKGKNEKGKDEKGPKDENRDKSKASGAPKKGEEAKKEAEKGGDAPKSSPNRLGAFLQKIGPWLKWLVFAVLGVIVLVALLRGGLGFLANFTDWARRLLESWQKFWEGLFGAKKKDSAQGEKEAAPEEEEEPAVPFSAFANPFDSGKADRMDPRELVRYTFEALEAWARERDLGRRPDETAQEFIARLGDELPTLEQEATRLGGLHARVEYARGGLPGSAVETVRHFWERLERVTESPMSA